MLIVGFQRHNILRHAQCLLHVDFHIAGSGSSWRHVVHARCDADVYGQCLCIFWHGLGSCKGLIFEPCVVAARGLGPNTCTACLALLSAPMMNEVGGHLWW